MARPVAVGAVLEISYVGRHENQRTLNVFHYGLSALSAGGTVDGDLVVQGASNDQFNTEGEDKFMDEYLQCLSEDFALERIRFQWVSPTRYSFTEELSAFPAGKFTGPALPPNVSGVIGEAKRGDGPHQPGQRSHASRTRRGRRRWASDRGTDLPLRGLREHHEVRSQHHDRQWDWHPVTDHLPQLRPTAVGSV